MPVTLRSLKNKTKQKNRFENGWMEGRSGRQWLDEGKNNGITLIK